MWEWSTNSAIRLTFTTIHQAAGSQIELSKHLEIYTLVKTFSNGNYSLAGRNDMYVQYINMPASACNTHIKGSWSFQMKTSSFTWTWSHFYENIFNISHIEALKKKAVCVAADESVGCSSGFVCFDLVSSVQVNIILKTWQAGFTECSWLLIFFSSYWLSGRPTSSQCTVNLLSQWQELLRCV